MSESMRLKNPKRYALLEEARALGIVGRHKMNTVLLRQKVDEAHAAKQPIEGRVVNASYTPGLAGVSAIRKARQETVRDDFETGQVIRWVASGRYTYVAIKCPVGWFTSAAEYNRFVPQIVDFETLVEILARPETTKIEVAVTWAPIEA